MKRALVDLAANLPEGAFIISTVHDELIVPHLHNPPSNPSTS
jgi:hypothetical protein